MILGNKRLPKQKVTQMYVAITSLSLNVLHQMEMKNQVGNISTKSGSPNTVIAKAGTRNKMVRARDS